MGEPLTVPEFLAVLKECPLIASVQASPGSPLDDPETLLKLAQASLSQGVKILRLEGVENIKRIKGETGVPVIGLIKRKYPDSELYITPTMREVEELLETGCEVIALDSRLMTYCGVDTLESCRVRSDQYKAMVDRCHAAGRLVLADCGASSIDLEIAQKAGCDLGSTTFGGMWYGRETFGHPDFSGLCAFLRVAEVPLLAEGHFQAEAHVRWAMHMGAGGVVVGGALNDSIKTTGRFVKAATLPTTNVGAVDIGGTWLRFGLFSPEWILLEKRKCRLPSTHKERMKWIESQAIKFGVDLIGVSSGGAIDPKFGFVEDTKETIPDNEGAQFVVEGLRIRAINDGLAAAWGHVVHGSREDWMQRPGERTVTIALGTGVGCGVTSGFGLLDNSNYPRLNDLEFESGRSFEDVLGGLELGSYPSEEQMDTAFRALLKAIDTCSKLLLPVTIYLCGGVAFAPWMLKKLREYRKQRKYPFAQRVEESEGATNLYGNVEVVHSPFGADAGLYGAAALALFPPIGVFRE